MSDDAELIDVPVFLAAFREGSISRAATALGCSLSTASRRLGALEQRVGRPLFARTPAGLEPTPAAHALLPHAEAVERAGLAGLAAISALDEAVVGNVDVALPGDMLLLVVLPRLQPFLRAHPGLTLTFDHSLGFADLSRREADIAVRVSIPERGDELVVTRLREVVLGVFARQDVVARLTDPADPREVHWIGWMASLAGAEASWLDRMSGGRYSVRCSSPTSIRQAAAAGLGAALLPDLFAQLTPGLVRLPIPPPPPLPLYMITHRAVRSSPRVRAVWNELERLLRPGPDDLEDLRAALRG